MERAIWRSLVLCDLVLYTNPLVGAVDGFGVSFLVRLCVHAAMGSSAVALLLTILGVGLVKTFCTLGDVAIITGTLRDEGISDSICGGGIGGGFGTL